MNVLIRAYDAPDANASGMTAHAIGRFLSLHGDSARVAAEVLTLDDVRAWSPDVVIGQQWATEEASRWATTLGLPYVMLVYGPGQYEQFMPQCDCVVFPSDDLHAIAKPALGRTPAAVLPGIYVRDGESRAAVDDAAEAADAAAFRALLQRIAAAGRRRPTLSLCMTVANEAQTMEAAVRSVADVVDEIIIGVDERSADATADIARRLATTLFTYVESSPPHFPRMRNRAMERVETDWAIVVDGHEWIENAEAIRPALETTAWSIEIQTLFEPDENRVPGLAFPFPRIHRRHVRFVGAAVHEEFSTPLERRDTHLEIKVWHERKPGQAAAARLDEKGGAELEVLRAAWEQEGNRRALFYLARGLLETQRYAEAVEAFNGYLEAPAWPEEGWIARLYLARCHYLLHDWETARREAERAVLASPERAEGSVLLGHILLELGESRAAAAWFRMAAALPEPLDSRLFVEIPVYRWAAWHGLALALERLGDYAGAVNAEERALAGGAGARAHENIALWRQKLEHVQAPSQPT